MNTYTPHLGDVSLLEACHQPGCPICGIRKNAVTTYLQMVLYAYVDDPEMREYLCNSWGYCQTHAWMLPTVERGNLLTVAVMYHDILEREVTRTLTRGSKEQGNGFLVRLIHKVFKGQHHSDPIHRLPLQPQCPACKLGHEIETNALKIMLRAFTKQKVPMQDALKESDGLCIAHLRSALELTSDPANVEILLTLARAKLTEIQAELNEFIRKHDYRFQHEVIGDEKHSWQRAINLIVGTE